MAALIALFGLLIGATVCDLGWRRLPNRLTYGGMGAAVLLAIAETALRPEKTTGWWGAALGEISPLAVVGWGDSLLGLAVCGGIMVACYVVFGEGGGDVKLLAMIGAFLGPFDGVLVMLWTFTLGASLAIVTLLWSVGAVELVRRIGRAARRYVRTGSRDVMNEEERKLLKAKLLVAAPALVATVLVVFRMSDWL